MTARAVRSRRRLGTYVLWVVTALGFVYLFVPIAVIALFSFNDVGARGNNIAWKGFTLDNWRHALTASEFTRSMSTSIVVALVACTLATLMGALVALALTRYRMRGGAFINLMLIVPLTTPEIVMGASLFTLFFNQDVERGFWTIVIAHTMFCISFVALTVKARIRGFDWTLEDAASDLGASPLRTFRKVTLPLITPGIIAAFLLSIALSIDDYIITSFVAGDERTFPRAVFDTARRRVPPQVHVIATMVLVVVIVIIGIATWISNRRAARLR